MKTIDTITTFEKFEEIIKGIQERRAETIGRGLPHRQEYFRGQADVNWTIMPGLTRGLKNVSQVEKAEKEIMALFKKELIANNYQDRIFEDSDVKGFEDEWSLLIQAQHYRIPTRLLDWTIKPEVALFFAIENPNFVNVDASFLVAYKPDSSEGLFYIKNSPYNIDETRFLNPPFAAGRDYEKTTAETRRARQHGKFSIQSYPDSLIGLENQASLTRDYYKTWDLMIEKYIIPAQFKPQLRIDIASHGFSGEFLYAIEDPIITNIQQKCKQLL